MMKINCSCIGKKVKEHIEISNLHPEIKNSLLNIRTCGEVSKFDAARMIYKYQEEPGSLHATELRCVIPKLKGAGLDYDEIKDLLLSMREEDAIRMEVGTPLDMTKENEKDLIIDNGKNRFAFVQLNNKWLDKMGSPYSFNLPDKTKAEMIDVIGKSIRSKFEHGFNLCLDRDNNIRPGKLCKGKKCSMETAEFECKEDEKTIGTFHTHETSPDPSIRDLAVGYLGGMTCIGNYQGIKCYKRKKDDHDALEYAEIRLSEDHEQFIKFEHDKLLAKEITDKEFKDQIQKYKKEVNRLVDSYFRIIDIPK